MVVDDFESMRVMMRTLVTSLGHEVVGLAEDGKDAYKQLQNKNCDLVISDWNMPVMEGIELLKKIRANPELKKLPVILVTAEAKKEQVLEAAQAGVNDYIVKPFNKENLEKKIKKIFG